MRIVSWNVNGIRSAINKGLLDLVNSGEHDIIMLQEVKSDSVPLGLEIMKSTFRMGSIYEYMFWDAAYRMEHFPFRL